MGSAASEDRSDLGYDIPQVRVWLRMSKSAHADADLRAVTSAKHRTVLYKENVQACPHCSKRGTHACYPSAGDRQIVLDGIVLADSVRDFPAELGKFLCIVLGLFIRICRQIDRIAAAVESAQIV